MDMHIVSTQQLRDRLQAAENLSAVARVARISGKTAYRIRDGKQVPSLDIAVRLVDALNASSAIKSPEVANG